jgi:hypothetical protein
VLPTGVDAKCRDSGETAKRIGTGFVSQPCNRPTGFVSTFQDVCVLSICYDLFLSDAYLATNELNTVEQSPTLVASSSKAAGISLFFVEHEGSLPCSQQLITWTLSRGRLVHSDLASLICLFNVIFPCTSISSKWFLSLPPPPGHKQCCRLKGKVVPVLN